MKGSDKAVPWEMVSSVTVIPCMCMELVVSYSVQGCANPYSLTNLYDLCILFYVYLNGKRTAW